MKIQTIDITNFLRLRRLTVDLTTAPVHLFAGHNEVGKTSLQEAVRFCFLGETDRVDRKSEYKLMITDGAKTGSVKITTDEYEIARDVATGKGTADDVQIDASLEYLLDATRYAWIDAKKRRSFMFGLLGVTINRNVVSQRLIDREIPGSMIDYILPLLRGGFDAAAREASTKTTEARGGWNALTGERHGSQKGADWLPEQKQIEPEELLAAEKAVKAAELKWEEALKARGAAGTYPEGMNFDCPSCGARLNWSQGEVRHIGAQDEAADPLASPNVDADEAVADAKAALDASREPLEIMSRQVRFNSEGEQIAKQAYEFHQQIGHWKALADALAPDGIPGEIIADKLKPLNQRLMATAMATEWPLVAVTPTLDITVEGRPFGLQSESSQWRAQASIAEAISFMSGVGLVVLDRMDVLDLANRAKLIRWMLGVADDHDSILLIGTLKEPPKLPAQVAVHWLVAGEEFKQEAA